MNQSAIRNPVLSPPKGPQSEIRNVCVVITARPSYARIKSALEAIQQHPKLQLQLVVGASALLER